jgi:hypothetical protein
MTDSDDDDTAYHASSTGLADSGSTQTNSPSGIATSARTIAGAIQSASANDSPQTGDPLQASPQTQQAKDVDASNASDAGQFTSGGVTDAFKDATASIVEISGSSGNSAESNPPGGPISRKLTHADYDFIPENGYSQKSDAAKGGLSVADILNVPIEELGGGIVGTDGHYWPTMPVGRGIGEHFSAAVVVPAGEQFYGLYHTHPSGPDSLFFSPDDVNKAEALNRPSYIGFYGNNSIRFFDPATMRPETVSDGGLRVYGASKGELLCDSCFAKH